MRKGRRARDEIDDLLVADFRIPAGMLWFGGIRSAKPSKMVEASEPAPERANPAQGAARRIPVLGTVAPGHRRRGAPAGSDKK